MLLAEVYKRALLVAYHLQLLCVVHHLISDTWAGVLIDVEVLWHHDGNACFVKPLSEISCDFPPCLYLIVSVLSVVLVRVEFVVFPYGNVL